MRSFFFRKVLIVTGELSEGNLKELMVKRDNTVGDASKSVPLKQLQIILSCQCFFF